MAIENKKAFSFSEVVNQAKTTPADGPAWASLTVPREGHQNPYSKEELKILIERLNEVADHVASWNEASVIETLNEAFAVHAKLELVAAGLAVAPHGVDDREYRAFGEIFKATFDRVQSARYAWLEECGKATAEPSAGPKTQAALAQPDGAVRPNSNPSAATLDAYLTTIESKLDNTLREMHGTADVAMGRQLAFAALNAVELNALTSGMRTLKTLVERTPPEIDRLVFEKRKARLLEVQGKFSKALAQNANLSDLTEWRSAHRESEKALADLSQAIRLRHMDPNNGNADYLVWLDARVQDALNHRPANSTLDQTDAGLFTSEMKRLAEEIKNLEPVDRQRVKTLQKLVTKLGQVREVLPAGTSESYEAAWVALNTALVAHMAK